MSYVVGYARTSTADQEAGFDAQKRDLAAAGCSKVFAEQVSSVAQRDQLTAAIEYLRPGDVLVVTKPDRLARSMRDLITICDRITAAGASLRILALNIDTATPMGKFALTIFGGAAEFERDMMLERQKEGIAKAHAEGKYQGREPTARRQSDRVLAMVKAGHSVSQIARALKIGTTSVSRIKRASAQATT
jgi:DNA invertase Pin-like site-specific DNA recombinase